MRDETTLALVCRTPKETINRQNGRLWSTNEYGSRALFEYDYQRIPEKGSDYRVAQKTAYRLSHVNK